MVHLYTIATILFIVTLINIISKLIVKYNISKSDIQDYTIAIGTIAILYIIIYLVINTILLYYSPI